MEEKHTSSSDAARLAAKILGSIKSEKKAKAARENGKKGGRKRKSNDSSLTNQQE